MITDSPAVSTLPRRFLRLVWTATVGANVSLRGGNNVYEGLPLAALTCGVSSDDMASPTSDHPRLMPVDDVLPAHSIGLPAHGALEVVGGQYSMSPRAAASREAELEHQLTELAQVRAR